MSVTRKRPSSEPQTFRNVRVKKEPVEVVKIESDDEKSQQPSSFAQLQSILASLKLNDELPHHKLKRKPKLKCRPPQRTVFDISDLDFTYPLHEQIELEDLYFLHYALTYARKTVFVTGAGVSVHSGIPDFRSSNGLFSSLATKESGQGKNLFDYNLFRNTDSIAAFEDMIRSLAKLSNTAQPSPFHRMMDSVSAQNRMLRLYTQNIDDLDTQLPNLQTCVPLTPKEFPKNVQLHGSIKLLNCSKCNYTCPLSTPKLITSCTNCRELNEVRQIAGKRTHSEGFLRPRIVLYNEFHPDGELIGRITEKDLKSKPDCLVISGTTLKIPGVKRLVKEMARVVHANNGYVIWINIDLPPQNVVDYIDYIDLVVVGDCQLVPGLVKLYNHM